jgi:hypothetical protein
MFPDGYKIKIKLQSLMPNNFNMYLDYLLNGSTQGASVDRDILGSIGGIVKNSFETFKSATGEKTP